MPTATTAITSNAITAANAAHASQAAAAAHEAYLATCRITIHGFQHENASIQEQQNYAGCIQALHPIRSFGDEHKDVLLIKALIIAAFLGMIIGLVIGIKDHWSSKVDAIFLGVIGLVLAPCLTALIYGLWIGAKFVLYS